MVTAFALATALASGPGASPDALYASVLRNNVRAGRVNYAGVAAQRDELDAYLEAIAAAKVPAGKKRAMAFYIDAYNALVLRSVLDAGTPKSVLDKKDFFTSKTHRVAGRTVSLDELEKKVLNPLAKDPRTHMVLVCAAKGCPILDRRPYVGSNVDRRMEEATVRYLKSKAGARPKGSNLGLSKIFEWYAADFGGSKGVVEFVRKRLADVPENPSVTYFDYDWRLNK
ncbi:MAG: DUF547 domain-containing protein [Myxococcota bacterium]